METCAVSRVGLEVTTTKYTLNIAAKYLEKTGNANIQGRKAYVASRVMWLR